MRLKNLAWEKGKLFQFLARLIATNYRCEGPELVDLELSNRCNLHCNMCWFHGESGVGDRYHGRELATEEVLSLMDQLAKLNPAMNIYLGGGEPFVRRDFLDIVRHIKTRGLRLAFTTNGTLMNEDDIEVLVALGVDTICFSIDGTEELHDRQRGKGIFRKATGNVRQLAACKARRGALAPMVTVNTTVTGQLVGHLQATLRAIREATGDGADFYRIHHQWFLSPDELSAHQSMIRQKLGCRATGAAGHLLNESRISDPAALAEEIEAIRAEPKVVTFPNLDRNGIINYYSENPQLRQRCYANLLALVIKPNGDATFCPDEWIDDYILGNVRRQRFDQIWNNEKARKFRAVLLQERHFDGCKRCSWMYSYP
jgi:radical SAM protein with 4Fe4S-binding SPASM domain